MKVRQYDVVRLTATAAVLALLLAGCGSSDDSTSGDSASASSTSAATSSEASATSEESPPDVAPADYSTLLMDPADLDAPVEFIMEPPQLNPSGITGVAALYHTADNMANIGDTIALLADPTEAANVLAAARDGIGSSVTGEPVPSPIGSNGVLVDGTSPDGTKAVTVLMFTEGNAFVTLQFDSAPGDLNPAPADFVTSTGQLQLDALVAGLPGVTPGG